jgi:hypothetical protein
MDPASLAACHLAFEAVGVALRSLAHASDGVAHEVVGERLFPRDAELRLELVFAGTGRSDRAPERGFADAIA